MLLLKVEVEDCLNTGLLEDLCKKNEGKGLGNGQTDRQKEIATPLKVLSELKKHEWKVLEKKRSSYCIGPTGCQITGLNIFPHLCFQTSEIACAAKYLHDDGVIEERLTRDT